MRYILGLLALAFVLSIYFKDPESTKAGDFPRWFTPDTWTVAERAQNLEKCRVIAKGCDDLITSPAT